jgi:hypothetical protein
MKCTDRVDVEAHLLRQRNPAHLNVRWILAGEVKHSPLCDFPLAEQLA